jgi:hypothetical protein
MALQDFGAPMIQGSDLRHRNRLILRNALVLGRSITDTSGKVKSLYGLPERGIHMNSSRLASPALVTVNSVC